ncbi:MnhA1 [Desulforapulum autotrophicum HRM2]|uniref:MnhA1 n=1 Tax=Desulforapulum autotrophicum (strain ATCC 43914 / DSM 3382 / VKM B-1955 / HRM2) TaxID=177437 RepID=C0Q993_DESAH|nr:Na(+)/H(+) antiporter subunit D [Desulforapulum autotrophicum]ACN16598.1 MnhA1 [Desulforapulum autotrophicum HRM2]
MSNVMPPFVIFILGALVIPFLNERVRSVYVVALPVVGFINLLLIPVDTLMTVNFLDYQLTLVRIDRLSLAFGYIFHIAAFVTAIYILHVRKNLEYVAGFIYSGAALGAIFAGDLFTFFVFWETLTVGSVMLIWARCTKRSSSAGFRYLMIHVTGGLSLLAGIVMMVNETGSIAFGNIGLTGLSSWLIFFGFGVNCAWPFLHTWLTDAYPEATIGGTVFLSAFTTKTAVYALARAYPGTELLIWIGVVMAAFPIFFAVIENDLRRVLAYSLVNQVGFMVVGIGIGTELAINGAVAHAFNDILFKGLLFMSMGAVMYRTGKINATDLGGLYKSMPWTAGFCIVGAASISAFPLFSGFVSKSMVMSAAGEGHMVGVWLVLLFASAGVFHHAGIKIPFFAFFGHDAGHRVKEAPKHMLIAMGITAFLCIFNGTFYKPLYAVLPYPALYEPYTLSHVVTQTELLFYSALAFTLLLLSGIYPAEIRAVNIDFDWFYRKPLNAFVNGVALCLNGFNRTMDRLLVRELTGAVNEVATNAMAIVAWAIMSPFVKKGVPLGPGQGSLKTRVDLAFATGTSPVGLFAACAGLFIVMLFVFI